MDEALSSNPTSGTKTISGWMARLLRGGSPRRRSVLKNEALSTPLANLPLEILQMIFDVASPADIVSFGLTCKVFWRLVPTQGRCRSVCDAGIGDPQKIQFLTSLERDLPELNLCRKCTRLYRWAPLHANEMARHPCRRAVEESASLSCYWNLRYETADLLFRYDEYGPKYGILPISLSDHVKKRPRPDFDLVETRIEAKICDQRLLVQMTSELVLDQAKSLETQITSLCSLHCPHNGGVIPLICRCSLSHTVQKDQSSLTSLCFGCSKLFYCSLCPTDYRITTGWIDDQLHLKLVAWKDLGKRHEQYSQPWRSHGYPNLPLSTRRTAEDPDLDEYFRLGTKPVDPMLSEHMVSTDRSYGSGVPRATRHDKDGFDQFWRMNGSMPRTWTEKSKKHRNILDEFWRIEKAAENDSLNSSKCSTQASTQKESPLISRCLAKSNRPQYRKQWPGLIY